MTGVQTCALPIFVLVLDVRHAPTPLDLQFVQWLDGLGRGRPPMMWLLNKADKLTQSERMKIRNAFRESEAKVLIADRDEIILFSAHTGLGMKECATTFNRWLNKEPLREETSET